MNRFGFTTEKVLAAAEQQMAKAKDGARGSPTSKAAG
jgi:hypothetical protein